MARLSNSPQDSTVLQLEQRKSFSLGLWFLGVRQEPVDLTGAQLRLTAAMHPRFPGDVPTVLIEKEANVSGPTIGYARIDLQASDLELDEGDYPYVVTLVTVGGYSAVVVKGELHIVPNPETSSAGVPYSHADPSTSLEVTLRQHDVRLEVGNVVLSQPGNFTEGEKLKLAGIAPGAEVNVNADWAATSGDAKILNKPELAPVALSGSFADLVDVPAEPDDVHDITFVDSDTIDFTVTGTKATGLTVSAVEKCTQLGTQHLNTVVAPGLYFNGDSTLITLARGYPVEQHSGLLEVFAWSGPSFSVVEQRFTTYRGASPTIPNGAASVIWTRGWSSNSNTWTEWRPSTPSHVYDTSYRQALAALRKITPYAPMEVTSVLTGERSHSSDGIMWERMVAEAPRWTRPTYLNSWRDYNFTEYHLGGHLKTSDGIVALSGLITAGTIGSPAFILPEGSRPDAKIMFPIMSNGTVGRLDILPTGEVTVANPSSNAWPSLDGIMFPAAGVATWTEVAPAGTGVAPEFAPGWQSYHLVDASWPPFAYWVDPRGRVWFRGLIRQITPSTLAADATVLALPFLTGRTSYFSSIGGGAAAPIHFNGQATNTYLIARSGTNTTYLTVNSAVLVNQAVRNDWAESRQHYNGWAKYSAAYPDTQFMKFSDGVVYTDGLVATAGNVALMSSIIPKRFAPDTRVGDGETSGRMIMLGLSNGTHTRVDLVNDLGYNAPTILPWVPGNGTWSSQTFRYIRGEG